MPFTVPIVAGLVGVIGGGAMMAGGAVAQCKQHHTCSRSVVPEIEMAAPALFGRKVAAPVGPCNVPLYNFDMCKADLHKIVVQSSLPAQGVAQFDNVPATCMVLANVFTGACGGDAPPLEVCGSACLKYTGLTDAQIGELSKALQPWSAN